MEEEDELVYEKKKFVCKFCSRKFPCGKSLGGHIRTHLNKKPSVVEKHHLAGVDDHDDGDGDDDDVIGKVRMVKFASLDAGQSGYSLRENPKKTWRFADAVGGSCGGGPPPPLQSHQGGGGGGNKEVCKECGKGFQSLKALCGHMACHSENKEKLIGNKLLIKEAESSDNSENDEKEQQKQKQKQLVMDSQSDTETSSAPPRQLRRISKRLIKCHSYSNVGGSMANGSSSGSGIEQEQQEVAISLMMLSRDSGHKGGLNSFGESSDNNSVVLEAKSSSIDMRISAKQVLNCVSKVNDVMGLKRAREKGLKCEETNVSDNSDSGYFRHEPKKGESDVSVDGFFRNGELHKVRAEFGSRFEGYEATYGVKLRKGFHVKSEMGEEADDADQVDRDNRGSMKYALRRTTKNGFHRPIATTNGSSNVEIANKNARKSSKYECLTCNKTFHSHRALGGHRASHTKTNAAAYSESMYESGENSIDTADASPVATPESSQNVENCNGKKPVNEELLSGSAKRNSGSKRSKGHECPFCFKVFKSGQALGGHKRSHFVGGCEVKTVVLGPQEQQPEAPHEAEITALFDLNLPAPMEEEANEHYGFMTW